MKQITSHLKFWTLRVLRWLALLAVALYAGYLLLANLALNTGLFARFANSLQDDLVLSIDSGWTVWPVHLHLGGLTLRFEDANVQFSVTAQRLTTDLRWRAAFHKTVHATHVRGEGMGYWFRAKFDRIEGNERRIAAFPVIPGYDPVPIRKPRPASTTPVGKLWVIRIEDVKAELKDIWMMEARFKGQAKAFGSFELAPRRHLWVRDGQLDLERGTLSFGKIEEIASSFSGKVRAEYSEHDPQKLTLKQNLSRMTWVVDLLADVTRVNFAQSYFDPGVRFSGGKGPFKISLNTRDNHLLDGSHANYSTSVLTIHSPEIETRLGGGVGLEVKDSSPRIDLALDQALLRFADHKEASLTFDGAHAVLDFSHARLDQMPEPVAIDMGLDSVSTGDDEFKLASGLRLGGKVRGRLVGRANSKGGLAGDVAIELLTARIHAGKHALISIAGKARARLLAQQDWLGGGSLLGARLDLTTLTAQSGSEQVKDWWLTVDSPRVEYVGMPPSELDTTLAIRAKDGRPLLAVLEQERAMPGIVGAIWSLDDLTARVRLRSNPKSVDVSVQELKSASLGGRGRFQREGKHDAGVFLVKYGPIGVGLELDDNGLSVSPLSGKNWFETRMRARFGSLSGFTTEERPEAKKPLVLLKEAP